MLDSKCQIFWTRTLFLGVNPKDSTRTRLVLDTLRFVLDSYSKNLDSIQHYYYRCIALWSSVVEVLCSLHS